MIGSLYRYKRQHNDMLFGLCKYQNSGRIVKVHSRRKDGHMRPLHLAEINIATPKGPLTSETMKDFVGLTDEVNRAADSSPGFIWRPASSSLPGDERSEVLITISVWESVESLRNFIYGGLHARVMQRRRDWFIQIREMHMALWWIPQGAMPSVSDGQERLNLLREIGPSGRAFSLKHTYPPPIV